ncbi:septum formation family protein [Mycolicibacillus parakoreensis]|nr:septum formation family protein [Mycolicibacillus parakoreensis]
MSQESEESEPLDDATGDDDTAPAADRPRRRWAGRLRLPGRTSRAARRGLLLTALGGLLIAGVITAIPVVEDSSELLGYLNTDSEPAAAARGNDAFTQAAAGDCLTWPEDDPQAITVVDCAAEHRFEVSEAVDLRTFPGAEYGPDADAPSPARLEEIGKEQCERAVDRYLGPRFDPNGRYTIGMLWSGDKTWRHAGERRMLCGLQLPGPGDTQALTVGAVDEQDQSKVFPPGTCLGIDADTNQPTDVPVDCATPHAMEVTGTVNLAERFPEVLPSEADQDGYIKEVCTSATADYLAPVTLRETTLTLSYSTISLPSWVAGSRQLACSVGMTLGNGGWATLLGSAKGELLINGQPPVPPPDIPEERLDLLPLPSG